MTKDEFKSWRKNMELTQSEVGIEFQLTRNTIQNYEAGFTPIPKCVEMSCKFLRIRKEML